MSYKNILLRKHKNIQKNDVPVQKIIGKLLGGLGLKQPSEPPHGSTTPMMPSGSMGMGKGDKALQKVLPAFVAPAALGAIGGKLLGLSKKQGIPVQKIIPGLGAAMEGVGQAVRGVGTTAGAVGDVVGAAGKRAAGAINPTKSSLSKNSGNKSSSSIRKNIRHK